MSQSASCFVGVGFAVFCTLTGCTPAHQDDAVGTSEHDDRASAVSMIACDGTDPACPSGKYAVTCKDGSHEVATVTQILHDQICEPPPPAPSTSTAPPASTAPPPTADDCIYHCSGPSWDCDLGTAPCYSVMETNALTCADGCLKGCQKGWDYYSDRAMPLWACQQVVDTRCAAPGYHDPRILNCH
jgi:hypothetical protein